MLREASGVSASLCSDLVRGAHLEKLLNKSVDEGKRSSWGIPVRMLTSVRTVQLMHLERISS